VFNLEFLSSPRPGEGVAEDRVGSENMTPKSSPEHQAF